MRPIEVKAGERDTDPREPLCGGRDICRNKGSQLPATSAFTPCWRESAGDYPEYIIMECLKDHFKGKNPTHP